MKTALRVVLGAPTRLRPQFPRLRPSLRCEPHSLKSPRRHSSTQAQRPLNVPGLVYGLGGLAMGFLATAVTLYISGKAVNPAGKPEAVTGPPQYADKSAMLLVSKTPDYGPLP